jgi:hypothetical protein
MNVCAVDGCEAKHYCRGWCTKHYGRWKATGDPVGLMYPFGGPRLTWLMDALGKRDRSECWEWPWSRNNQGYGRCYYERRQRYAHNVALILDGHPQPPAPRDRAMHSCDNPPCVNPAHLRWATQNENVQDKVAKQRQSRGEGHPRTNLTAEQIRAIRSDTRYHRVIAADYGVTESCIAKIQQGKRWRHVA